MRFVLLLLLSGCALRDAMIEQRIADAAPMCAKMGYKPDTDAFRDCQLKIYHANEAGAVMLVK